VGPEQPANVILLLAATVEEQKNWIQHLKRKLPKGGPGGGADNSLTSGYSFFRLIAFSECFKFLF
jgi:hypothetical protein